MKKIAIDIREAVADNPAGKGIYNLNLARELTKDKSVEWILLSDKPTDLFENVVVIDKSGFRWHLAAAAYAKRNELDHYLSPTSFLTPLFLDDVPFSIVVHDLICFIYPKGHNLKAKLIEKFALPKLLKKAENIFTVSNNTKKDLLTLFPRTDNFKISVTHCGVNTEKFKPTQNKEKIILTVSTLLPRKNILGLVQAFDKIKDQIDHHLVIVGGKSKGADEIEKYIKTNNLSDRVHIQGYVAELEELYSVAELFVYPSFYEGFGIPIIEALASGTKVACSDRSSLPEAGGKQAAYFNPDDVDSIAGTILKSLKEKPNYETGIKWAKNFTWKAIGDRVLRKLK